MDYAFLINTTNSGEYSASGWYESILADLIFDHVSTIYKVTSGGRTSPRDYVMVLLKVGKYFT